LSLDNEKVRYLTVGGFNTIIGYFVGVSIYLLLQNRLHILFIIAIANIISISISFITFKAFVFKTRGGWLNEYLKIYLVYGSTILLSGLFFWLFVDYLSINIWLAQGVTVAITAYLSYIGNKKYTFKRSKL
jgi:putative flippase GtrA